MAAAAATPTPALGGGPGCGEWPTSGGDVGTIELLRRRRRLRRRRQVRAIARWIVSSEMLLFFYTCWCTCKDLSRASIYYFLFILFPLCHTPCLLRSPQPLVCGLRRLPPGPGRLLHRLQEEDPVPAQGVLKVRPALQERLQRHRHWYVKGEGGKFRRSGGARSEVDSNRRRQVSKVGREEGVCVCVCFLSRFHHVCLDLSRPSAVSH